MKARMQKNRKIVIYEILLVLLIVVAVVIAGNIINKQHNDKVYDKENREIAILFHEQEELNSKEPQNEEEENQKSIELNYKGYKVIGLIEIQKIDLEYPIIEKTTQETMKISISRFYGGEVNEYGNISLAGHNNYNGTMFGKNKDLRVKDTIILTDLTGRKIEYEIYEIFTTDPNDTSILETEDKTKREVTLITCKNGRANRLIIKAKERND